MAKHKKVGIFYLSLKDGIGRQPVSVGPLRFPPTVVYVRCEIAKATELDLALDEAEPRRDEIVMNTHFVE